MCLPHKHEDVSSNPQNSGKKAGRQCTPIPLTLWKRILGDPRGLLPAPSSVRDPVSSSSMASNREKRSSVSAQHRYQTHPQEHKGCQHSGTQL